MYFAPNIAARLGQEKSLETGLPTYVLCARIAQSQQKRPAPGSRSFESVMESGLEAQTFVFLLEL
jgi:hypothetical protein